MTNALLTEAERDVDRLLEQVEQLQTQLQQARTALGRALKPQIKGGHPWRVGRRVGRTLYDANDQLIGVMDTPELAAQVVAAVSLQGAP